MTKSDAELLAESIKSVTVTTRPSKAPKSPLTWNSKWPTWLDRTVFYSTLAKLKAHLGVE